MCLDCFVLGLPGNGVSELLRAGRDADDAVAPASEAAPVTAPVQEAALELKPDSQGPVLLPDHWSCSEPRGVSPRRWLA